MNLTTIKEEKNIRHSGVHPVSPAYMFLTITTELRGLCFQVFEARISRTHGSIFKQMSLKKHIPNTVNMNTDEKIWKCFTISETPLSESKHMSHTGGLSCGFGNDFARVIEKSFQHVLFLRQATTSRRSSIPVSSIHPCLENSFTEPCTHDA